MTADPDTDVLEALALIERHLLQGAFERHFAKDQCELALEVFKPLRERLQHAVQASNEELPFIVEKRGDTYVIDWSARGGLGCRPATADEVVMWNTIQRLQEQLAMERLSRAAARAKRDITEQVRQDALRYRFLAERMSHVDHPHGPGYTLTEVLTSHDRDLDEVIDRMMESEQ